MEPTIVPSMEPTVKIEIAVFGGNEFYGNSNDSRNRGLWWLMVLPTLMIFCCIGIYVFYKKRGKDGFSPRRKLADHTQCHSTTMTHNHSGSGWNVSDLEETDPMAMDDDLDEDLVMMVGPTVTADEAEEEEKMAGSVPHDTLLVTTHKGDGGMSYGGITQIDDDEEEDGMVDDDLEEDYIDLESNGGDADPLNTDGDRSPMIGSAGSPKSKNSKASGRVPGFIE